MNRDEARSSSMLHSKIIADTAKETLAPLGIAQKGSRCWIDDRGWWIVNIEFQPSGFGKGSYLNVGAMWLWHEKEHFTFDVGYRIAEFVEYVDEKQFRPEVSKLASTAQAEALRLRSRFASIHDAARFLPAKASRDDNPWTKLSAAIALGYVGKTLRARWLFKSIERKKPIHDWEYAFLERARGFAEGLDRPADFRRYVQEAIWRTRKLLRLTERAELDIDREDGAVAHRWKSRFIALRTMIGS
jgi:hypothetical protein